MKRRALRKTILAALLATAAAGSSEPRRPDATPVWKFDTGG